MPGGLEKLHGLSPFLAWCLSSSPLISLSLSLSLSLCPFFILLSLTLLSLFTHHLFPLRCPFLCLYQSFHVIAALSPSSPRSPVTYPCFYFSPPLSSFFSRATASPLFFFFFFLWVFRSHHAAGTPQAAHVGSAWLSPGPPWVLLAGQFLSRKKCLKKAPPPP